MLKKAAIDASLATAGTVASMLAGLLIMPHLIAVMGSATYGRWSLIAGLATYLVVLDFGVTSAVYRLTARSSGGGSMEEINGLVSTSVALLTALAVLLCILTAAAGPVFLAIFGAPTSEVTGVSEAIWIVGLSIAVMVPLEAYAGVLWAYERFDLLNGVDIIGAIARTVLILAYVGPDHPLVRVAFFTALTKVLASFIKALLCYRLLPTLSVRPSHFSWRWARELFSFGIWMNVLVIVKSMLPQIIAALVAALLGVAEVTPLVVARQLVFYTNDFTNAATQVVAPRAARLSACGDLGPQQQLLIQGGKFSHALGMMFLGGYMALGSYFIHIWQRGTQDAAYVLLVILMAGEVLPISQWITYSQIVGAIRQRALAWFSLLEAGLACVSCLLLMPRLGLVGACVGVALAALIARGLLRWWYGCQMLHIRMMSYLRKVYLGVTARAAVPIALAWAAGHWISPSGWVSFLSLAAAYAVVFAVVVGLPLIGPDRVRSAVLSLAKLSRADR